MGLRAVAIIHQAQTAGEDRGHSLSPEMKVGKPWYAQQVDSRCGRSIEKPARKVGDSWDP